MKALVRNAPAPGLVRQGKTKFVASATFSDGTVETLEKGTKVSTFTIEKPDTEPIINAKSGVKAPEDVEQLWAIPAPDGREIAFATQHEPPFLLAEPASAVAKVLGDLTNASMLMDAVQKLNKYRNEALNDAKARFREAEEATEQLSAFDGLDTKAEQLQTVSEKVAQARKTASKLETLDTLIHAHGTCVGYLSDATIKVEKSAANGQSVESALRAISLLQNLESLIEDNESLVINMSRADELITYAREEIESLESAVHELLGQNQRCPLCQQEIK